jgi:hypothetical protein
MSDSIRGILVSADVGEMSGFQYGILTVITLQGDIFKIRYDRNSQGDMPDLKSEVIIEAEGESPRVIQITTIRTVEPQDEKASAVSSRLELVVSHPAALLYFLSVVLYGIVSMVLGMQILAGIGSVILII